MNAVRCPWYIAGPLMGLLIVGLRAIANRPFGALGGYVDIAEHASAPGRIGFRGYLLLGLVVGGATYGLLLGRHVPTTHYASVLGPAALGLSSHTALLVVSGVVMGVGARTAGGCTSGHGMSGMSLGSAASVVSSMTFFATAVGLALLTHALGGTR